MTALEIAALRRKYEEIVRLREQALAHPDRDPRRELSALAAEFPGALREADELPMEELRRRVAALAASERGTADVEPWMAIIARFHALTRGALCAKRWLEGRKQVDATTVARFEHEVSGLCYATDAHAWRNFLPRLATPPRGRVSELVFERMAEELTLASDEVRVLVFGASRRQ